MAIVLSVILFFFSSCSAMALEPLNTVEKPLSAVDAVRVRQIGSNEVLLELDGRGIGHPELVPGGSCSAELRWRDTVMSGSGRGKHEKGVTETRYDYPLVRRISFTAGEDNSLTMRITGGKPLRIKRLDGMDNSDSISILLEADTAATPNHGRNGGVRRNTMPAGGKITLSMREVSPADAFRALAALAGINIALDGTEPPGRLTFSFKDTAFSEVFNYLLNVAGLSYSMKGDTLFVGSLETVASAAGDYETRAYPIAYADAGKAASLVASLVPRLKTPSVDERTRTLYITATAAQHQKVDAFLRGIDHPGRQVMLEARLIDVSESARREIEAMISSVHSGWIISYGAAGGGIGYASGRGGAAGNSGARAPGGHTMKDIDAGLSAIESKQRVKVLASPSLVTLDGHKAVIKLTRNYLYQSSVDSDGNAKFTEQETGPSLEITPQIGRDGFITMKLRISSGEIIGFRKSGVSESPETSRREVDTSVRVRDGELFVIGGLYSDSRSKNVRKVPVLGHIPLIGELFTSRSESRASSELAFIVVPHILGTTGEKMPASFFTEPAPGRQLEL